MNEFSPSMNRFYPQDDRVSEKGLRNEEISGSQSSLASSVSTLSNASRQSLRRSTRQKSYAILQNVSRLEVWHSSNRDLGKAILEPKILVAKVSQKAGSATNRRRAVCQTDCDPVGRGETRARTIQSAYFRQASCD